MFDRFVGARAEGRTRPRALTLLVSAVAHAGLFAALVLWSFWRIDKVEAKTIPIVFAQAMAPPPPPPPPAAPPAPAPARPAAAPKKPAPDPFRAPVPTPEPDPEPQLALTTAEPQEPSTTPGGPGGVVGSTGPVTGAPDAGVTTPPPPPKVAIVAIEAQRVAGNRDIRLPDEVKVALLARGQTQVTAAVKLCLDASGAPDRVQVLGSTGFPAADAHIRDEIAAWRYRPYRVNGQAVPVCTAITLRYQIQDR